MKYFSFFKMCLAQGLQYRFSAIAGLMTQFFWGLMMIFLYEAFYNNGIATPMEWSKLMSYIWLGQAFYGLVFFRFMNKDIFDSLRTGQIAYEFVRPLSIYWMWFAKICAERMSACFLRIIPVIIFAVLLPCQYRLGTPASFEHLLLFIITLAFGVMISTSMAMLVYIIMFHTTSCRGIFNIYGNIADFVSGMDYPIAFMPDIVKIVFLALPFSLCVDLPFRLYIGDIPIIEGMQKMMIQVVWMIVLIHIGQRSMNRVAKKVIVQGG